MIKYADLYKEYLECRLVVDTAIERCIANSSFINGPEVSRFETLWAQYVGHNDCAGVSSGTSALMLALDSLGIGPGDEVIVPTMSFISTAEVVSQLGATPVFVDIDEYYTINIQHLASAITDNTRAIIFVDLYGQTIDIDSVRRITKLPLIRDAAQSAGAKYYGDDRVYATCWSFYPGKNLSAIGDAGAVTGDDKVCTLIRMLRDHGREEKYKHLCRGWNERLDGIQAAVLTAKLPFLNNWNSSRQRHADLYKQHLSDCKQITLPKNNPVSTHVYNQFVITTPRRDDLKQFLHNHQIECGIQFPLSMHQQPVYANLGYSLPASEELSATCLSLPVHAQLNDVDIIEVASKIKDYFRNSY